MPLLPLTACLDPDADFVRLLEERSSVSFALAVRMLGNTEDARDALQEAWIRAWRNRATVRTPEATNAWLRTVVARECLRVLERRAWRRWIPFAPTLPEPADPTPSADGLAVDAQLQARLRAAVHLLPPRQRLVWGLRFDEGWTVAEIAAATHTRPDTVRTHLDRALATVQRRLGAAHVL